MREEADNRNVSLRTQEETEVRMRVATMKRVHGEGQEERHGSERAGCRRVRVACCCTTALSKTVVVSDDGLKTCVSVAAKARAMASMTAAAEMQCERYVT